MSVFIWTQIFGSELVLKPFIHDRESIWKQYSKERLRMVQTLFWNLIYLNDHAELNSVNSYAVY